MKINVVKIKKQITLLGLNYGLFSNKAFITRQTLHRIFREKSANLKTIEKIARALDLDSKDLIK